MIGIIIALCFGLFLFLVYITWRWYKSRRVRNGIQPHSKSKENNTENEAGSNKKTSEEDEVLDDKDKDKKTNEDIENNAEDTNKKEDKKTNKDIENNAEDANKKEDKKPKEKNTNEKEGKKTIDKDTREFETKENSNKSEILTDKLAGNLKNSISESKNRSNKDNEILVKIPNDESKFQIQIKDSKVENTKGLDANISSEMMDMKKNLIQEHWGSAYATNPGSCSSSNSNLSDTGMMFTSFPRF